MDYERTILANAERIRHLYKRIGETYKFRDVDAEKYNEWQQACRDFHARFGELSFPGGYDGAIERIEAGDPETIEAALCFLECRPYFFRSSYMFTAILRRIKRAELSDRQAERLKAVMDKRRAWRSRVDRET